MKAIAQPGSLCLHGDFYLFPSVSIFRPSSQKQVKDRILRCYIQTACGTGLARMHAQSLGLYIGLAATCYIYSC